MIFNSFTIGFGMLIAFAIWRSFSSRAYRRPWQVCATLLIGGLLGFIAADSNTFIDQQGVVHEPWPLIALATYLFLGGLLTMAVLGILHTYRYAKDYQQRLRSR
ncbi:DUF3955 domain-containing protein [Chitinimonas sp. PSY-7]|uniref:DUF3955 domain-containing protein n=1 Tax=Chitinimonas sp. PSY-7 TaxID=3459088 RepID=UPI00403FCED5